MGHNTEVSDEEYFGELKMMFNTRGWEIFTNELMDNVALIGDIQNCSDEKDLYYKQGQLASIGVILNFPDTIKRAEADSQSQDEE